VLKNACVASGQKGVPHGFGRPETYCSTGPKCCMIAWAILGLRSPLETSKLEVGQCLIQETTHGDV
jgi:hypothetical protein